MREKRVTIMGAGLAGLSAAITARKLGYEVTCLDKYDQVGGMPEAHPAVDATPMNPERMSAWLDVPVGEPQMTKVKTMNVYVFGRKFVYNPAWMRLYNVERGHRKTAIDRYLHDIAVDMGVNFEWGHGIEGQRDLAELPPNSIVCTGPYREGYDALRRPYEMAYGYTATTAYHGEGPHVAAYFDEYTKDYAYVAASNGVVFALFFSRRPVNDAHLEKWKVQLSKTEDITFKRWDLQQGAFASRYPSSPALFWGDKILAGTLAAAQDPGTYFGCHGAMVSGKIAALALEDKAEALKLFRWCCAGWNRMWIGRKVFINYAPDFGRKIGLTLGMGTMTKVPTFGDFFGAGFCEMIPGYRMLRGVTEDATGATTGED